MTDQVDCVKNLHTATLIAARVGQVAVVIVCGQRADAGGIRRSVADSVQHFHITDVVNIQRLFQAHHKSLQETITSEFWFSKTELKVRLLQTFETLGTALKKFLRETHIWFLFNQFSFLTSILVKPGSPTTEHTHSEPFCGPFLGPPG